MTASARKRERNGILRTVRLMWTLRFLYRCGMEAGRLCAYGGPPGSPYGPATARGDT